MLDICIQWGGGGGGGGDDKLFELTVVQNQTDDCIFPGPGQSHTM